jgi:hypothetical protein
VVPDHCTVEFEVRNLPGEDPASLLPATGAAEIEQLAVYPALDGEADGVSDLLGVPAGMRSTSAPRPGCMRSWASPPPSAGRATSATPTAPTSRSRCSSWTRAPQRWAGCWRI